jgi:Fe-S-cluster containining protein
MKRHGRSSDHAQKRSNDNAGIVLRCTRFSRWYDAPVLALTPDQQAAFRAAALAAAADASLLAAIDALYADVQSVIDARRPRCDASGRCCRFESYGHRLFVTTAEAAHFAAAHRGATGKTLDLSAWDGAGCPLQADRLCNAHAYRPFGCRIFFCDPSAGDWQHEQYEQFHTRLKVLHETHRVPYYYVEWRAALRAICQIDAHHAEGAAMTSRPM